MTNLNTTPSGQRKVPFVYLIVGLVLIGCTKLGAAPAIPTSVQSPTAFTYKILGVKTCRPIPWTEEPKGPRGEPWYTVAYLDSAWPVGNWDEKNTVPPNKSKLWRVPVRVDVPPAPGNKVILKLAGDDDLTAYMDGYLLGTYGTGKKGGKPAGEIEIDVTDRLTVGTHIIAVRLDNRLDYSRFIFHLLDRTPGTKEAIRQSFWTNLTGKDEQAKRQSVLAIRKLADENPEDSDLQLKKIYSYLHGPGDLCDHKQAAAELQAYKQKFRLPVAEETAILKMLNKAEQIIPRLKIQATDMNRFPNGYLELGDALKDVGDLAGASEAYETGFRGSLTRPNFLLDTQLDLALKLISAGQTAPVIENLTRLEERVKQSASAAHFSKMASLFENTGDFDTADRYLLRYEQQGSASDKVIANNRRITRAFNTGDFTYCLSLIESENQNKVLPHLAEERGVRRVQALSAMGKKDEAKQACGSIPWTSTDPNKQSYLFNYMRVAVATDSREQMAVAADRLSNQLLEAQTTSQKPSAPNSRLLIELAECLKILNKSELACRFATMGLDNTPDTPLPWSQWYRGRCAVVIGDNALAIQSLTKAKTLDPKNYWINQALNGLSAKP